MKTVHIVYVSTGGNTLLVSQAVQDIIEAAGHTVVLQHGRDIVPEQCLAADVLVLACPTYGHGLLDTTMSKALTKLASYIEENKFNTGVITGTVIGLGDAMYDADYHIESGKLLLQFLQEHKIEVIQQPLLITGSPVEQLDTTVSHWANLLSTQLN